VFGSLVNLAVIIELLNDKLYKEKIGQYITENKGFLYN